MAFLVAPDNAKAPAAWVAPPQYNLMATVQVAARADQRAEFSMTQSNVLQSNSVILPLLGGLTWVIPAT